MDLFNLRDEYKKGELHFSDLRPNPLKQILSWMDDAEVARCTDRNSIALSTVSETGGVSSRMVLLKKIDDVGLYFFSSYKSRKGEQLEKNPNASIIIYWPELERQINIEGVVEKCSREISEAYFYKRPYFSRISAVASDQSQVVKSRAILDESWQKVLDDHKDSTVRCPEDWGGYILKPTRIEFWQGRENRFHDRILYQMKDEKWDVNRLAP